MKQPSSPVRAGVFGDPLRAALQWLHGHVRPAHGVIAVATAAALALAGSQLLDFRGISVGAPAYAGVEGVASAPEIDRQRAGVAHGLATYPIAIAAIVVIAVAVRGRWKVARLLVPLGLAAVVISLVVDAPHGLDENRAALAYEGAEAVLLEGFWAQLFAGATLACCGLLLAAGLSTRAPEAPGRRRRGRPIRRAERAGRGALLALCATKAPMAGRLR